MDNGTPPRGVDDDNDQQQQQQQLVRQNKKRRKNSTSGFDEEEGGRVFGVVGDHSYGTSPALPLGDEQAGGDDDNVDGAEEDALVERVAREVRTGMGDDAEKKRRFAVKLLSRLDVEIPGALRGGAAPPARDASAGGGGGTGGDESTGRAAAAAAGGGIVGTGNVLAQADRVLADRIANVMVDFGRPGAAGTEGTMTQQLLSQLVLSKLNEGTGGDGGRLINQSLANEASSGAMGKLERLAEGMDDVVRRDFLFQLRSQTNQLENWLGAATADLGRLSAELTAAAGGLPLPEEVIERLASYLPRRDFNNLALTSKKLKRILYESRPKIAHWPETFPFAASSRGVPVQVVFSPNMSRVAITVRREGRYGPLYSLLVLDVSVGLIASVDENHLVPAWPPTFSPNGQILVHQLAGRVRMEERGGRRDSYYTRGVRLVQLPPYGGRIHPPPTPLEVMWDEQSYTGFVPHISSLGFIGDNKLGCTLRGRLGVWECDIVRQDDGRIVDVGAPRLVLFGDYGDEGGDDNHCCMASALIAGKRWVVAYRRGNHNSVILRDMENEIDTSISLPIATSLGERVDGTEMLFAPDGSSLVVYSSTSINHRASRYYVHRLDCSHDRLEDISLSGEVEKSDEHTWALGQQFLSVSRNSIYESLHFGPARYDMRIIDLKTKSDETRSNDESCWWWKKFVN